MWPFKNKKKKLIDDLSYVMPNPANYVLAIDKIKAEYEEYFHVEYTVGRTDNEVRVWLGDHISTSIRFHSVQGFIENVDKVLAIIKLHKLKKEMGC